VDHGDAGAVLDTAAVSAQIDTDAQTFKVQTIGYDRWGANDVTKKAGDGGLTMVGVGQGYGSLSAPLKETLRLTLVRRMLHGGNPVMRWMVDNLAVAMDPAGNVKPDKAAAADKIDGVSALVTALRECMDAELVEKPNPAISVSSAVVGGPSIFRPTSRLNL
jgi:phage terminase large subunit-like protein